MKQLTINSLVLASVFCFLFSVLGCQPGGGGGGGGSSVLLVEAEAFPEHLAGVWRNESDGWILMFEADGRLSRLTHTIGRTEIRAGQESTFDLVEDGRGYVRPGQWLVQYDGVTDELAVDISLESFRYQVLGNEVRGSSRDVFIGPAPRPGQTVWRAGWISLPEFVATTAGGEYVDYELPVEPGQEDKGEITFEKVDLDAYR